MLYENLHMASQIELLLESSGIKCRNTNKRLLVRTYAFR
jgi:hypothetical protein